MEKKEEEGLRWDLEEARGKKKLLRMGKGETAPIKEA